MNAESQQQIFQQIKVESLYQFDINKVDYGIKQVDFNQKNQKNLHNDHQVRSQHIPSIKLHEQNDEIQKLLYYKRQLLKLMVMIKMEQFGLKKQHIQVGIQKKIEQIKDLELIESKSLNKLAVVIFSSILLRVLEQLLQVPDIKKIQLFMRRQVQNESQIQIERQDVLPEPLNLEIAQNQQHNDHFDVQILCSICYSISNRYLSQSCGHSFCRNCIKGYLTENLRSGNFIVKCPQFDCNQFVSNQNIKKALPKTDYERFLHFKEKYEKQNNPENIFCTKPDCGQLLDHLQDRLKCPKCNEDYCEICIMKYHQDNPCDIALKQALEQDFNTFKIKKCPNCKSPIEKSDGCNHMSCKKCKFQFCWICLSKYTTHHFKYYNCLGCPGMQFQNENQLVFERCKQMSFFCLLPLLISIVLICFLTAIPIYMIGSLFYKPCHWLQEGNYCQNAIANKLFSCFGTSVTKFFTWLLYLPRAVIYMIFIAPVKIIYYFCIEISRIFT